MVSYQGKFRSHRYFFWISYIPWKAAQLALEAAERRKKVAAQVTGAGLDKRSRPTPTKSTKVTPESKKLGFDFML